MNEANFVKIKKDLLRECEDDWIALWWILAKVRKVCGENCSNDKARALVMRLVAELLSSGKVEAGCPTSTGGWKPWRLSHPAALTRIEAEWDALGEDPDIGKELVWFTASPRVRPHQ
ncbi:MAG: hypothetical protein HY924_02780 [Elusimicrobia bacterium]|nr:hypothetical protein [Elusimicrobiota bacterium]